MKYPIIYFELYEECGNRNRVREKKKRGGGRSIIIRKKYLFVFFHRFYFPHPIYEIKTDETKRIKYANKYLMGGNFNFYIL
jgi:hypothetical protein